MKPIALLLLATVCASSMSAQGDDRSNQLRGRLVDSLTRHPIAAATVEIDGGGLRQLTDSSGRFAFRGLSPGHHVLRMRHVGYVAAIDTIQVQPSDTVERAFPLARAPVVLEELTISGHTVKFPASFAAAYKRAAQGRGFFFTREDIEQANANDYQTLLNKIPGVSANNRGITFQRCQSGLMSISSPNSKAKVQVFIDGFRMPPPTDPDGIYEALRTVKPQGIQIMEVYTGVARIPAEFLSDACAVIVIWTKRD